MHLVILHGYLLSGTGSNIYVANIAQSWARQGHGVTVLCQDREAGELPFVKEYIGPGASIPDKPPRKGRIRIVSPDIGHILPVYVGDAYEGFRAVPIPQMKVREIEDHIERFATALRSVCGQGVDRLLANHAMLGPVIAKRGTRGLGIPYDVKIHGSAVEFCLAPHPRLLPYAVEGLQDCRRAFVGTSYMGKRLLDVLPGSKCRGLRGRLRIVSPGMDPLAFRICSNTEKAKAAFRRRIGQSIAANPRGRTTRSLFSPRKPSVSAFHRSLVAAGKKYDQRVADSDLLRRWRSFPQDGPLMMYVGKFMPTKGLGELVTMIPEILGRVPGIRIVYSGFGEYREHMELYLRALRDGDKTLARKVAVAGGFAPWPPASRVFRKITAEEDSRILITGYLDHRALSRLLPLADVSMVPSVLPEAFGMVAVEAMSCGVLPLCTPAGGLADLLREVGRIDPSLGRLMRISQKSFPQNLARRVAGAFAYLYPAGYDNRKTRERIGKKLRRIAVSQFAWDRVATQLLNGVG